MKTFYQLDVPLVLENLSTNDTSGLNNEQILLFQKEFGQNILKESKQKSRLTLLLDQFKDVMIIILIVAAVISFIAGEQIDAYVILAIIVANAWMGYSQEYGAEQSIRLLQKMVPQSAMVLRNHDIVEIEAEKLVPGDILILQAGNIIPADARLIKISAFKTNESSLTGESQSVEKTIESIAEKGLTPGDQLNMVFKGTQVINGSAKAVVSAIGMNTELGKIAGMLETGSQKTPLQKRLAVFSKQLAIAVIIICLLVFAFGIWRGAAPFQMFLTALALAVAALPEALPAVITIALAGGARRMVKQKALMRKLPAVETLGSVTYICTDKTGTLTKNIMTVEKIESLPGKEQLLMNAMILNNEVRFSPGGLLGDSTETALIEYAVKNGFSKQKADEQFPFLSKLPFDSVRMRMSTLHKTKEHWILFVKGAPAKLVEVLSPIYKDQIPAWLDKNRAWAVDGLRVLFFGYRIFDKDPGQIQPGDEHELNFLGMTAMIDPPREEVIEAIKQCKTAGIKLVMITGDQLLTATAIAKRLGMLEAVNKNDGALTGSEIQKLSKEAFNGLVETTTVYARVSPEQKLNIVKALQDNGEFVAMTGDGVNDAPSLKQSDIGIAMGITGTDVSKESADMILLDDNFATIIKAVKEGRRIYDNIRKFILYVLSSNMAEILTIFLAPIFGFAIPLLPIHILWINLVTDGFPGLALVAEPAEADIMDRHPRSPKENLFANGLLLKILLSGFVMTASAVFIQWWAIGQRYDVKTQQTMVFATLCFIQLINALSVRSTYRPIFSSMLFTNKNMWQIIIVTVVLQCSIIYIPFLQLIFKTGYLDWHAMSAVIAITLICGICIEALKYLNKRIYFK